MRPRTGATTRSRRRWAAAWLVLLIALGAQSVAGVQGQQGIACPTRPGAGPPVTPTATPPGPHREPTMTPMEPARPARTAVATFALG